MLGREAPEARNARLAEGYVTEDEIKAHWEDSKAPLFEHELVRPQEGGAEQRTRLRIRALTEEFKEPLLEEVRSAWDESSYKELERTLEQFFAQRKLEHPLLTNVEYYIATDTQDRPFAITGIYTNDIQGGRGFATREQLDPAKHNMAIRLGWFSVSERAQGAGVGGYLLDWTEKMAQSRGATHMAIETDDYEGQETALKLYEKRGYQPGMRIPDYFGPGRELVTYAANIDKDENVKSMALAEKVTPANKEELLALAQEVYSPERFEEFRASLDIFLQQKEGQESITRPNSFVLRDSEGKVSSFSLLAEGVYENMMTSYWDAVRRGDKKVEEVFFNALKGVAKERDRGVIMVSREGENPMFSANGFSEPGPAGVPETFEKGDPTNFLLYSKRLQA